MIQIFNFKNVLLSLLLVFGSISVSQAACYFPTAETETTIQSTLQQRLFKKYPKQKFKTKSTKKKTVRDNRFGNLALWALVAALGSSILTGIPAITMLGTFLMGLFFVASCGFAMYGLFMDENKRKARVILIINLALVLSFVASFWIITLFTL